MTDQQNIDIAKIIKRLELIKSLILLEEEGEINGHILKLQQLALTSESKSIVHLLREKEYSKAIISITAFLNQNNQVGFYTNPEIEGLKLEAKVLEAEVNQLSYEKADLEKLIYDFGARYNKELGDLIIKLLRFKKNKAKGTAKEAEAEKDYNDYSKEYEVSKDEKINTLSEAEQKELKQKYRMASKLCHPDVVSEEQKDLATKIFAELSNAYERNDLRKVREILENLEKGDFFVNKSDSINEKQLLKSEIEKLRLRIKELRAQVSAIKESEAFRTINSIRDWDDYFIETRQRLNDQITELENARK